MNVDWAVDEERNKEWNARVKMLYESWQRKQKKNQNSKHKWNSVAVTVATDDIRKKLLS